MRRPGHPNVVRFVPVQLDGLLFAPWVNRKGEIVRAFRVLAITPLEAAARKSA